MPGMPVFLLTIALLFGTGSPASLHNPPAARPAQPKEITHVRSLAVCTALKRGLAPAIGHVLENDRIIATSRPLFEKFVADHASALGENRAAEDLDVSRLETLIRPLVKNNEAVKAALGQPGLFATRPRSDQDRQALEIRSQLLAVEAQQESALNVIGGFVSTQQMGELQAASNDTQRSSASTDTHAQQDKNRPSSSPTAAPDPLLNAGLGPSDAQKNDPSLTNTDSLLGSNPLNQFARTISSIQQAIVPHENAAASAVMTIVPVCGGQIRVQATPPPSR